MPDVRIHPGRFQKDGTPRLQRVLRHFFGRFRHAVKGNAQRYRTCRQIAATRSPGVRAGRSDACAQRRFAEGGCGRELRKRSGLARPDQAARAREGPLTMKFANIMSTGGEWLRGEGPHHQIVISSRVRLARNLKQRAFPGWAKKAERTAVLEMIKPRVEELPEMQDSFSELLQDLSALEKQVLVERHLISREHAAKSVGSAVVMNRRQTLSIMINEEDHLRMQSIRSGLQLKNAFKLVDKVDSTLEGKLDFAYDAKLGYLTACPTNVGTGMRASAMLHLPGLVLSEMINQVIQAVNKIGLAVRGLYGEGTEAMGNLFQISNQTTLGEKEEEIVSRLSKVIETIIEKEHDARQMSIQKKSNTLWDQIGRAYGVLTFAHAMTSKEALNLLSIMKLGIDLGAFPEDRRLPIDELFIETQPAHLQKSSQQKLNAEERDHLRAQIIRERLRVFPKPDITKVAKESENGSTPEPPNQ